MRDFHKRSKTKLYKSLMYSTPVIILLVVIVLFMAKQTWSMYQKSSETEKNLSEARAIYTDEKSRETELVADIERLQTESGVEEEIRNTYGYIREGEEMIMIIDGDTPPPPETTKEEKSFWEKVKNIF